MNFMRGLDTHDIYTHSAVYHWKSLSNFLSTPATMSSLFDLPDVTLSSGKTMPMRSLAGKPALVMNVASR